jgi:hypothetical protein
MAKLGVGVGEDFPVDDGQPAPENCPHADWHAQHHHRWFHGGGDYPAFGPPHLIRIVAALALAGLVIFALTHIVYVAAGAVVLAVLYVGHHRGFDFTPTGKPPAPTP